MVFLLRVSQVEVRVSAGAGFSPGAQSPLLVSILNITAVGLRLCLLASSWLRLVSASRDSIKSLLCSILHRPSVHCFPSGGVQPPLSSSEVRLKQGNFLFYLLAISWSRTSIHWQNLFCHTPHFHFESDSLAWSCSHWRVGICRLCLTGRWKLKGHQGIFLPEILWMQARFLTSICCFFICRMRIVIAPTSEDYWKY